MPASVFVNIVRPGKAAKVAEIDKGQTLRDAFAKASISSEDYAEWAYTDEDGDELNLDDPITATTAVICGQKVDGASA